MKITLMTSSLVFLCASAKSDNSTRILPSPTNPYNVNNTKGLVPGDSNNGIKGLRYIWRYLNIYSSMNGGKFPEQTSTLINSIWSNRDRYGIKLPSDIFPKLSNVDSKFSDEPYEATHPTYAIPYYIANVRPNGTPISSPKMKGERDAVSWTKTYFHENAYVSHSGTRIVNPTGHWLVLWDDSKIDKVPYDDIIYLRTPQGFYAVPQQQAGIDSGAITYSEYWTQARHAQMPPIGKPLSEGNDEPIDDNGAPESLIQLSRRESYSGTHGIDRADLWKAFDPSQSEFTLSDVQSGATKLGLDTQVQKLPLDQLQKSGSPALLFLKDDGRLVTLTSLDADRAVVVDRGLTRNVERSVLETRYSGEALVPTKALTQQAGIVADDAVRSVQLPSLDAEMPQQFTLRNTSKTPVTLQLEYPLLGVTDSKLSKDTLAPGETATLDLKVKWRSILKAPYQNVLVSLQTSDPIVPRLQLAILLNPPQTTDTK